MLKIIQKLHPLTPEEWKKQYQSCWYRENCSAFTQEKQPLKITCYSIFDIKTLNVKLNTHIICKKVIMFVLLHFLLYWVYIGTWHVLVDLVKLKIFLTRMAMPSINSKIFYSQEPCQVIWKYCFVHYFQRLKYLLTSYSSFINLYPFTFLFS